MNIKSTFPLKIVAGVVAMHLGFSGLALADPMEPHSASMSAAASDTALTAKVKSLWENKLSLIPEFWDRLTALNDKVKSLQGTLANQVKVYTVGTWARDRDCLWNIAKKKDGCFVSYRTLPFSWNKMSKKKSL